MAERKWLIPFTDAELDAIYLAIEGTPADESTLDRVIDKIIPRLVGDPRPSGALSGPAPDQQRLHEGDERF